MPYQIGKAFSDEVLGSIDRARDRAVRGQGGRVTRTQGPADTSLQQAYLRAEEAERDRLLRRELALEGLRGERERYALDRDARFDLERLEQGGLLERAQLADARAAAQGEALAGYREESLGLKRSEAEARQQRDIARTDYEQGALELRGREAEAAAAKAALDEKVAEARMGIERATTRQKAMDLIAKLRREALQPDTRVDGKSVVSPEKRRSYAALIQEAARTLTYQPDAGGRGMGDDLGQIASEALRDIVGIEGEGWDESLDELDETTGYVDLGG